MNIHCPIEIAPGPEWSRFRTEVSMWRGRMIERFADVEHAVTEALIELGASSPGKKLPHLAGQRREALRLLLAGTSFGERGKPVLDALSGFEKISNQRTFLCHGRSRILVDGNQQWHVHLTVLAPVEDADRMIEWLVSKPASQRALADLNSAACRIIDRLRNFRSKAETRV